MEKYIEPNIPHPIPECKPYTKEQVEELNKAIEEKILNEIMTPDAKLALGFMKEINTARYETVRKWMLERANRQNPAKVKWDKVKGFC